jgi:predicted dienelactone hydrolase
MTTRPTRAGLPLLLFLLLALLPLAGRAASPEPTVPASTTPAPVVVTDVTVEAGDRSFGAKVFAPAGADADGDRLAGGPWPVVIFGHGYLSPVDLYTTLLTDLAAAGYLVVAPTSGGELFPDHASFAADFSAVIDWLTTENARPGSWLEGAVDLERIAASGHSMGGGASTLATAADPRIRTVANLAAAETRPSAVAAAAGITVPSLLIAGELDAIAPVETHQRPIFEAITTAPAQLRIITGGSHCGFIDDPAEGGLAGALTGLACDAATIDREAQLAITNRLLVDWLAWAFSGDAALASTAWNAAPGDGTTIETSQPAG